MNNKQPTIVLATNYLLFAIAFTFVIIIAKNFLYPIALAVLFAYLLFPIANFFEKRKIPRILANLLSIIVGIILISLGFYVMIKQLENMVGDLPTLKDKALNNIDIIAASIESNFGIDQAHQKTWVKEGVARLFDSGNVQVGQLFGATTGTILRLGLQPVFIFFLLYYRDKAYKFIKLITIQRNQDIVELILTQVSNVTKHYMGGVVIVVMILCVLNSFGLWVVGMKYAILLGIIAAVCNFIPYFGTILGFSFPLVFALLTESSPQYAIGVVILFVIVQFIENNILTPNIVGHNVQLNPFIIILSLMVGAMVWGIPGMLVIVPLMAVLRIICDNIDSLKPWGFLLGVEGTEKHEVTLDKLKRLFKRLKKTK